MSAYALPGLFPPLPFENNIGISSCGSQDYQTSSEKADFKQPLTDGYSRPWSPPVEISLKEAKIDALQLIQSLTKTASAATTTQQQSKKRGQRRNSPALLSAKTDVSKPEAPPHELAMQFELDVSYHGRQYTVVRSLHRIRQLREELLQEQLEDNYNDESKGASDDSCCSRRTTACWSVPELPSLHEYGSYANQSFSLLHALLRSYAPALECWLQKLFRLVSTKDSSTLRQFLLEPVCFLHSGQGGEPSCMVSSDSNSNSRRCGRRSSSLESIEEHHEEHHDDNC